MKSAEAAARKELSFHIDEARYKAIDSLSRYKFMLFGYWAAIWVHLNRIEGKCRPNPFHEFVVMAKEIESRERKDFYCAQNSRLFPEEAPNEQDV